MNKYKLHTTIFSHSEIDLQIEEMVTLQSVVAKIKNVRDKWVGHRDPIAFNNPEDFLRDNEIDLQDFEKLINLAKKILQIHINKFDDTEPVFEVKMTGIDNLIFCIQARKDIINFIEEMDLSIIESDVGVRQSQAIKSLWQKHSLHPRFKQEIKLQSI